MLDKTEMVQYIIEWILYIITKQTLWKDRLWITQLETSCLSRGWVYMALLLTTKFSLKIILCLVHIKNVYQKKGRKFTVCGCFLWILNTDQKFGNTLNLRNLLALPSVMNVMPYTKKRSWSRGLVKSRYKNWRDSRSRETGVGEIIAVTSLHHKKSQ